MSLASYLPSGQFSVITLSIALAAGLVAAAHYATRPAEGSRIAASSEALPEGDWRAALEEIQAEAPGPPEPPSEELVQEFLKEAQTSNVTQSVARTLFVNLSDAGAQGLGSDIPTQEKLIAEAAARVETIAGKRYRTTDLLPTTQTEESLRLWGNGVMQAFIDHPRADQERALYAVAYAADHKDASALKTLEDVSAGYADFAQALSDVPVPSTLVPLHLTLVNNLSTMAAASLEMADVLDDPLRGLAGLQAFQASSQEAGRVLIALAAQLKAGGIIFSKDEAGSEWSFLASP